MSNSRAEETPTLATDSCHKVVVGWSSLSLEIRLAIWGFLYLTTPARIVEVQTAEHDHYSPPHDLWCPRYSPSPAPLVVNVCREARDEARRLAARAGYLLFAEMSSSSDIYFNPTIDTLYIPNDKNFSTENWGPEEVSTQIKVGSESEKLRSLAVGLNPQVATWYSLRWWLMPLMGLEEVILVVKQARVYELGWMQELERYLHSCISEYRQNPGPEIVTMPHLHPFSQHWKLATICDGKFQFVDQTLLTPRTTRSDT